MEENDIPAIFSGEVGRPVGNLSANALGNLNQNVLLSAIFDLIDRIEAQTVQVELFQPVERRFGNITAHGVNVIGNTGSPGRHSFFVEEIWRQQRQIVTLRAEMIQHNIEHNRYAVAVSGINEGFYVIRRTIGRVRRIEQHAIVAPTPIAAKLRHGQDLYSGDTHVCQIRQFFNCGPKRPLWGKGSDM